MKIVITGGNGYLGARLCEYFSNLGDQVIPVCYPDIPENLDWSGKMWSIIKGDLRNEETIEQIADLNPDTIIHLVSLDHFDSEKEPRFVNEVNVLPTWRLLERCSKAKLNKFIYFSTVQVYGRMPLTIITENQPVQPLNTYGLTHLLSEQICNYYNRKISTNVISVRLSNSYGDPLFPENNCWWLAINDLCRNAYTKKEIRLLSDGTPQRDFIHGNDVCKAIKTLINEKIKKSDNNVYHISSGVTLTLMELALIIKQEYKIRYNQSLPIITPEGIVQESKSVTPKEKYKISNQKIQSLGFSPEYSIERGIKELFAYLEKQ